MIFFVSAILILLLRHVGAVYHFRLMVKLISVVLLVYVGVEIRIMTVENFLLVRRIFRGLIFLKMEKGSA